MRALFAIFMVVLIGNPVCCCAFAMPEGRSEAAPSDLPPCCRARLAAREETQDSGGKEEPSPGCPCAVKLGFVSAEKAVAPPPQPVKEIPALLAAVQVFRLDSVDRTLYGTGPGSRMFLVASQPPPRLLYGVFRC